MDELVRWLGEQFDEDERIARQATEGPWIAEVSGETGHCVIPADAQSTRENVARTQLLAAAFDAAHIAAHDPDRVLREIDAKRRTLIRCEEAMLTANPMLVHFAKQTLREMALPYQDRPGYEQAIASAE